MKKIIIFGNGQIAQIVNYYFEKDSDYKVEAFCVDDKFANKDSFLRKPLVPKSKIRKLFSNKNYKIHIALSYKSSKLGFNEVRKKKFLEFKKMGYLFANYISSKSNIPSNLTIGKNCVILENQSIQPFVSIKDNVMVWSGAVIGHHSIVSSHSWITSGANIGGNCKIGEKCFAGLNSTIGNMVHIGRDCFIGANALVTQNVSKNKVCIENDTKIFKLNIKDFRRLTNFK